MILEPSVDNLLEKIDSKYAIVIAASSRARELHDEQNYMLDDHKSPKYVGQALEEIIEDKLTIEDYK
ncbi:DNA-directed RNA polymerase subunit omega [Alkalibacillus sp. S2W]|uniref:DNA-directed RNA polymerase subunit omega n=1 Tax=Alkalibacillus salilacus TaxID=284582 RepID=A0ABT9VDV5_9BACI|nr:MULTISPECIES: DNA-directed RNA polymerase subunit omega [Alkalibacillus]MDQ0159147.1 DNA-directed RNA polymerase subunit omega [Alkalibacillus salilacus]NIK10733.1 DNA-directed RNA polymerase subunit omega [Alkalibacillus almallahensis]